MQIRRAAQYISNKNKRPLLAAEIGVRSGENMLAMLQEMNLRALFLVDPYLPYDDGGCYQTKEMQDINRANMLYRASGYFERIVLFFQKSQQAVRLIPDKYFDSLEAALIELADKIEKNQDVNITLQKITNLTYIMVGNGYYLFQKGHPLM